MALILVFGLGNPGNEYTGTRHNIGFSVADVLSRKSSARLAKKRYSYLSEITEKGNRFLIIKPLTYMNRSGEAVKYYTERYKVPLTQILVVYDDVALPFGTLRLRPQGGAGGHNGLSDIIHVLENRDFPRLRFGVGKNFMEGKQTEFVLGKFTKEEQIILPELLATAAEICLSFGTAGIEKTMTRFNKSGLSSIGDEGGKK